MANRPRRTPKCDFSPKRTDLKEPSQTAEKTSPAEHEKPQLTAAPETFLPNGHSTTPPKSPESRQNPFRSVVYGEKIGFGARFGLDPNTREHHASVDKAPEGTMFPEARLQGLFGMREVPGLPGARKAAGTQGYWGEEARGRRCARLPGARKAAEGGEAAGARTYLECNAPPCPRISEFAPQPQPFPRPLLQV